MENKTAMIVHHHLYKSWGFLTPLIHWARTEAWGYSSGPWFRKKTPVDIICGKSPGVSIG